MCDILDGNPIGWDFSDITDGWKSDEGTDEDDEGLDDDYSEDGLVLFVGKGTCRMIPNSTAHRRNFQDFPV